ncbi:MAG: anaerobic ribonucleoside-triphosphate reductase [DPANN group archaeon]|nr:anaerobic ribonucleoside-triphosphate reductase [DPANN group archaeon]
MYEIETQLENLARDRSLEITRDGEKGVFVKNNNFDNTIFVTLDALKKNSVDTIVAQSVQGRDVDQITRITGYFSIVSNWNKGKLAELKDRYRVGKYFDSSITDTN